MFPHMSCYVPPSLFLDRVSSVSWQSRGFGVDNQSTSLLSEKLILSAGRRMDEWWHTDGGK